MARGSTEAKDAASTGLERSGTYAANAGGLFGSLAPSLLSEAAHPAGFSPTDMASMDTAGQQTAGGSAGAAVGSGVLKAARTRNAGGSDAAVADSTRTAGESLSNTGLSSRLKNASLRESQRRSALSGLGGLFQDNTSASGQALGQVPGSVNANTNAASQSWDWMKNIFQPLLGAAGGSKWVAGGG